MLRPQQAGRTPLRHFNFTALLRFSSCTTTTSKLTTITESKPLINQGRRPSTPPNTKPVRGFAPITALAVPQQRRSTPTSPAGGGRAGQSHNLPPQRPPLPRVGCPRTPPGKTHQLMAANGLPPSLLRTGSMTLEPGAPLTGTRPALDPWAAA